MGEPKMPPITQQAICEAHVVLLQNGITTTPRVVAHAVAAFMAESGPGFLRAYADFLESVSEQHRPRIIIPEDN